MKISACLIVKNEEKYLDRCLQSIYKYVDEIIITDTGSTDKTIEIAKKYTDKIYFFEWINNFSAARNFCQSQANGDYIFWIDADEYFSRETCKNLISFINNNSTIDTFDIHRINIWENLITPSEYTQRVIRNNWKFKWVFHIHEILECRHKYTDKKIDWISMYHNFDRKDKLWHYFDYYKKILKIDIFNSKIRFRLIKNYLFQWDFDNIIYVLEQTKYIHYYNSQDFKLILSKIKNIKQAEKTYILLNNLLIKSNAVDKKLKKY